MRCPDCNRAPCRCELVLCKVCEECYDDIDSAVNMKYDFAFAA